MVGYWISFLDRLRVLEAFSELRQERDGEVKPL